MTATPDAGVVNDYLILQYANFIFGLRAPAALVRRGITSVLFREGQRRAKARHPNIMSEPRRSCSGGFLPAIRSISTRTKRSTKVGRLSSSHDLSIGCS